jgi:hypothetical protein
LAGFRPGFRKAIDDPPIESHRFPADAIRGVFVRGADRGFGVLAVVTAGLYHGWRIPRSQRRAADYWADRCEDDPIPVERFHFHS